MNSKLNSLLICILSLFLISCSSESDVKKSVRTSLKDPDSAKFGRYSEIKNGNIKMACLSVNAKNAFGGYVGEKQAIATKIKDEWVSLGFHEISHESCLELITKLSNKANS